jgi:hypothetical protein
MQECWIQALSDRRHEIHRRWEALLRVERTDTPLANPDALVHMIDWTIDEVFKELRSKKIYRSGEPRSNVAALRADCHCGHNPFFNHFLAGEQALLEALVLVQTEEPSLDPVHRDTSVAELYLVINAIARSEVEAICSLCQHHLGAKTQPIVTGAVVHA